MYFEINVSLRGHHFFATAPRSIPHRDALALVLAEFHKLFTEERGYEISVTKWETVGEDVPVNRPEDATGLPPHLARRN